MSLIFKCAKQKCNSIFKKYDILVILFDFFVNCPWFDWLFATPIHIRIREAEMKRNRIRNTDRKVEQSYLFSGARPSTHQ